MKLEELYKTIKERPFDYVYLKRKRKFKLGDTEIIYGENEQNNYCVLFSPDNLDTQYPLMDTVARMGKIKPISVNTDYKHEYFSLGDVSVQECISNGTAQNILDRLNMFLENVDWYFKC